MTTLIDGLSQSKEDLNLLDRVNPPYQIHRISLAKTHLKPADLPACSRPGGCTTRQQGDTVTFENKGALERHPHQARNAMPSRKILAIGLDGFETSLAEEMISDGELPELARLRRQSAFIRLDHGAAQRTGLAWEHVASGLSPEDAARWSAVTFDPNSYQAWQEGTSLRPFTEGLRNIRSVVFDAPYFDLLRTRSVQGVVSWGAHDPGVASAGVPNGLLDEFIERFGDYPAKAYLYAIPWPCPKQCEAMGQTLTSAVDLRNEASLWLLRERLPDWDFAMVVVSEPHSAIEGLWHGVDSSHPLHAIPSSKAAGDGLRNVYRATDRLVGRHRESFPDATLLVFSMGGMGSNQSDAASMLLLAELLHRHHFGRAKLLERHDWSTATDWLAMLAADENWHDCLKELLPATPGALSRLSAMWPAGATSLLKSKLKHIGAGLRQRRAHPYPQRGPVVHQIRWMPLVHYQEHWPQMDAFALPSFYDGRIRINLRGRERRGKVKADHYWQTCERISQLLLECRDPRTGLTAVQKIEYPGKGRDPLRLGPTESDLVIVWNGPLALQHPRLGRMGPVPYRRTGGHTGRYGVAWMEGPDLIAGDYGVRSSFDIVPTLIALLGQQSSQPLSGDSMLPMLTHGPGA